MCLDFRQRIIMVCAAAFALTAFEPPAAAQPKLESSSLGHWRGYWISTIDPRMQGPVEQFINTERNRRVLGTMEWNTAGGLLELDLAGTTSASCRFNYVLTGMGASEGIRMVINGIHDPGIATGEYMLFDKGLIDRGHFFLVQDFNGAAPDVRGHYMGTATSDAGVPHDFALYITGQDRDPKGQFLNGNFEGFAEAPNTTPFTQLGEELRFDFDGRVDDGRADGQPHALVVGLGPAGIFFVDAHLGKTPDGRNTFTGDYLIFFADGTMEAGMLELALTPIVTEGAIGSPGV